MSRRCEAGSDHRRPVRAHWRPSEAGGPPHLSAQNLRYSQRAREREREKDKEKKEMAVTAFERRVPDETASSKSNLHL